MLELLSITCHVALIYQGSGDTPRASRYAYTLLLTTSQRLVFWETSLNKQLCRVWNSLPPLPPFSCPGILDMYHPPWLKLNFTTPYLTYWVTQPLVWLTMVVLVWFTCGLIYTMRLSLSWLLGPLENIRAKEGRCDGSADNGACHQVCWPELTLRNPHGGRRGQTLLCSDPHMWCAHFGTHSVSLETWLPLSSSWLGAGRQGASGFHSHGFLDLCPHPPERVSDSQ